MNLALAKRLIGAMPKGKPTGQLAKAWYAILADLPLVVGLPVVEFAQQRFALVGRCEYDAGIDLN